MKRDQEQGTVTLDPIPSLLDRLKIRRAKFAKEVHARLRRYDRQIELLEQSDAETIVRDAETILLED